MTQPSLFAQAPCQALQTWRFTLPCCFGARATWDRPVKALGWYGRDHCWRCATYPGEPPKRKGKLW